MLSTHKNKIDIAYVFIFYIGFQGGKYFLQNRIQEVGFAVILCLFFYGAIKLALQRASIKWQWWFWCVPIVISYPMIISSVMYYLNTGSNVMYSFFATREFLILFLSPTIYFLYKLGYPIERLEKVIVFSLVIAVINYLFFYLTLDLPSMALGGDEYMAKQVTWDPWRGYRLKAPSAALIVATCYCLIMLIKKNDFVIKVGVFIFFGLVIFIWSLLMARTQMASLFLSIIIYVLFFMRPKSLNILMLVMPIILVVIGVMASSVIEFFLIEDHTRAKSFNIALQVIREHPIFGFGTASWKGITYQSIFGKTFYPSDIGFIGIFFKYGIVGGILYLAFIFYLLVRIVKANWCFTLYYKYSNPLLVSFVLWDLLITFNVLLIPTLVFTPGMMMAAIIIGLTACYRDKYSKVNNSKTKLV